MNWQSELVASADDAFAFIKRQIAAVTGAKNPRIVPHMRLVPAETATGINLDVKSGNQKLLGLTMDRVPGEDNGLARCWVHRTYRGHGLGHIGIKAALGIAHESKLDALPILTVINDGAGFLTKGIKK